MIRHAVSTCYTNYGSTAFANCPHRPFPQITGISPFFANSAPTTVLVAVQLLSLRARYGRVELVLAESAQVAQVKGAKSLQDVVELTEIEVC